MHGPDPTLDGGLGVRRQMGLQFCAEVLVNYERLLLLAH